ncbi:hypothetical protein NVV37_24465, partial [Escherichia coli]|nr:hypothetical protein [Escherichia coli]
MIVECADAPIEQTDKEFCYDINANFDGLLNNRTYKVVFKAETQNPINGEGMKLEGSGTFFTQYEEMKLNQKPKVTQLDEKGGVKIDFSSLVTNNGTLDGDYSFINNFIFYENEALS